jgi:hypothetical protein
MIGCAMSVRRFGIWRRVVRGMMGRRQRAGSQRWGVDEGRETKLEIGKWELEA